jgi:hypothetical protein
MEAVESASEEYSNTPKYEYVYESPEQIPLLTSSDEREKNEEATTGEMSKEEDLRQFATFNFGHLAFRI